MVVLAPASVGDSSTAGAGGIPIGQLKALKAATVFVKVEHGPVSASGSGFVLLAQDDTGYIVTNEHVVSPPPEVARLPGLTKVS